MDFSVGENKTTVTGTNTLKVTYEDTKKHYSVTQNGSVTKIDQNQSDDIQEMIEIDNKIVILNEAGELSYINFEKPNISQLIAIDSSQKTIINSDVKELFDDGSYLTNNNEIYIAYDGQYYKKADNVKKVYNEKWSELQYISNDNELFFFDWSNPVIANYEKYAENVKEYFGDYSYSMLDGTSRIRLKSDGSLVTINEDVRKYFDGYYIASNYDLYKENTSVKVEFNKVVENVKDIRYDSYINNNGELFRLKENGFEKVAENVKYSNSSDYYEYLSTNNELYYSPSLEGYELIASNVKDYTQANSGEYMYISTTNRFIIENTDTGYNVSKYGIKDGKI